MNKVWDLRFRVEGTRFRDVPGSSTLRVWQEVAC